MGVNGVTQRPDIIAVTDAADHIHHVEAIGVVPISQLQTSFRQPTATLAPESDWLRLPATVL